MKSKFIPLLAVSAAAVLSLTACGGSSGGGGGSTSYKFSFVQGVAGDEFYITMQCGIQAEAKKQGVTVNTQGPAKFDPTLQKPIVDSVVAAHPNALLAFRTTQRPTASSPSLATSTTKTIRLQPPSL